MDRIWVAKIGRGTALVATKYHREADGWLNVPEFTRFGPYVLEANARVAKLEELLTGLVESEDQPCQYDHHGCCQMHGWFGEPGECYTRMAREELGL